MPFRAMTGLVTLYHSTVLVVDDFGIKYISKDDLDHLISTLEKIL